MCASVDKRWWTVAAPALPYNLLQRAVQIARALGKEPSNKRNRAARCCPMCVCVCECVHVRSWLECVPQRAHNYVAA